MKEFLQLNEAKIGFFFLLATILILGLTFSGVLTSGQTPTSTPSPSNTPTASPAGTPSTATAFGAADSLVRGSITAITANSITITPSSGSPITVNWNNDTRLLLNGLTSIQIGQNATAAYIGSSKIGEFVEITMPVIMPTPSATPVATITPTATPTATPKQISVNASFTGKQVDMSVGDTLAVILQSNPSTGFSWQLVQISDPSILQQLSNQFNPPASPLPGAPGNEGWTFKALKTGTAAILMQYSQPFAGGIKGAQTFSLTVNVR